MKNTLQLEVIGMMSGTSLDGLDLAWCRFDRDNPAGFALLRYRTLEYPDKLQQRLANAVHLGAEDLFVLDAELGRWFGEKVQSFIGEHEPPDLLASHGHTVFHQPDRGFTVQIGNASQLHAHTGIPVISDFRSLDVALGGQGAPLVPVGDAVLFAEYDCCVNLGGIANISYQDENGSRLAWDVTFCNMVLNLVASRLGLTFDRDGQEARSGSLLPDLQEKLDNWDYYTLTGPRSLGFEDISRDIFPLLVGEPRDILHTCTHHLAARIMDSCPETCRVLITGGGAHNTFLRECLAAANPGAEIIYPDTSIVDYKEAIVFALLAARRCWGMTNVLASVTGASRDSSSGQILG